MQVHWVTNIYFFIMCNCVQMIDLGIESSSGDTYIYVIIIIFMCFGYM
jgi:hypothetical protein